MVPFSLALSTGFPAWLSESPDTIDSEEANALADRSDCDVVLDMIVQGEEEGACPAPLVLISPRNARADGRADVHVIRPSSR